MKKRQSYIKRKYIIILCRGKYINNENEYGIEALYSEALGISDTNNRVTVSTEDFDGFDDALEVEIARGFENLNFIDTYSAMQQKNSAEMIRMCKKLSVNYGLKSGVNEKAAVSIESLVQSTENVLVMGIKKIVGFIIKVFKAIIGFIGKMLAFIVKGVLNVFKSIIHRLTAPKRKFSDEDKKKIINGVLNAKGKSSESLYKSLEYHENVSVDKMSEVRNDIETNAKIATGKDVRDYEVIAHKFDEFIKNIENNRDNNSYITLFYQEIFSCRDLDAVRRSIEKTHKRLVEYLEYLSKDGDGYKNLRLSYDMINKYMSGDKSVKLLEPHKWEHENNMFNHLNSFKEIFRNRNGAYGWERKSIVTNILNNSIDERFYEKGKYLVSTLEKSIKSIGEELEDQREALTGLLNGVEKQFNSNKEFQEDEKLSKALTIFNRNVNEYNKSSIEIMKCYKDFLKVNKNAYSLEAFTYEALNKMRAF